MDKSPVVVERNKARKRLCDQKKWKRNVAKLERYSAKSLPARPNCSHKKTYECNSLTMSDLINFHTCFYKHKDKRSQDAFILKHMTISKVARYRPRKSKYAGRNSSNKYYIRCKSIKMKKRVCQNTFLSILGIKRYRVEAIAKRFHNEGVLPEERRGGDHKSHLYSAKQKAVIEFIKKLNCSEPHYCRGSSERCYLPAELSINKLFKIYNNSQDDSSLKVKRSYFRNIFNTKFNLGFGSPQTDVCSVCLQYTEKIKTSVDDKVKTDLMIQKRIHTKRAKAFYNYLKDQAPNVSIFSFDCQKNMPLPKIPDQSTYYSRQFYVYNFTIVTGPSNAKLNENNTFSYIWTEDSYAKDSNLIASSLYHRLNNTSFSQQIDTIRLMADGCAGQNKNFAVIGMCQKWMTTAPKHIKKMEIIFPVVGHSFLPPDRVFGRTEKEFRKRDTILEPCEYINLIKENATIIEVGKDCLVQDWKEAVKKIIKTPGQWHIPFMKCKRFIIKRSKLCIGNTVIKGEVNYMIDTGVFRSVCKKNKRTSEIDAQNMESMGTIKSAKVNDVNKLLTSHFGDSWRQYSTLSFYDKLIPQNVEADDQQEDEENICEENVDLPDVRI